MKTILLLCMVLFAVLVNSCDEIGMPYEKKTDGGPVDTTKVYKTAFLEDFTGATCRNCPAGHRLVNTLRSTYGERLITMSVHAGGFAEPDAPKYPGDYRTAAGNTLNSTFGISSYPSGLINRSTFEDQFVQSSTAWATDVAAVVAQEASIKLELSPVYTAASGDVAISVKATAVKAFSLSSSLNVALYVVEDSVIAPQLDGSTYIADYVHRDMLRDAPLGALGSELSSSLNWTKGASVTNTYHTSLSAKNWNPAHIKIIAVVCEKAPTYSVWQAAESGLK